MHTVRRLIALAVLASVCAGTPLAAATSNSVVPYVTSLTHTDHTITLNWGVPPYGNARVGYIVMKATALDGTNETTNNVTIQHWYRTYTFTGLASGTPYEVSLDIVEGSTDYVYTHDVTTSGPPRPWRGAQLAAPVITATSASITWTLPPSVRTNPVRFFLVSVGPPLNPPTTDLPPQSPHFSQWAHLPANDTSASITGLTPGTDYVLRFYTVALNGYLSVYDQVAFTTPQS